MNDTNDIIIDYDGPNITNHQMSLDDFVVSVSGCYDLLNIIAKELNIPEEYIQIKIGPLEPGSIKAKIVIGLVSASTFLGGYVGSHFLDGMGVGEIAETWGKEFAAFIKLKKDIKIVPDNLPQQVLETTDIQGKLLQNKDAYTAVADIVKCLNKEATSIEINLPSQKISETLHRNDVPNLISSPFDISSDTEEEIVEERTMTLFLENVGITGDKWTFYEKQPNDKKKPISASVLDGKLLKNARNASLEKEYKNVPLICTVKIKMYKKAGAKRFSPAEFYIINCQKDEPLSLF